ncbi:putative membrane glycine and proline rich protein [Mycobacterium tuberculosis]|nr:putative membrane glycine and proline rich protein [Mycobacterium tuberculosis]
MQCVADGPGYAGSSPTLGPTKTSSITVGGVRAARVDADITIADSSRNVKGDSVTIIAVDTKPVTVFLGATPIGDATSRATVERVIEALKVNKS